ncbi:MAG: hypothetical protein AUJ12_00105 [Alphaproteobacteria bacterium CG1_02_46_17]|nr:MAG: hypothetical protein AUJ12_00105 [Alphaproteobacteria bacterium CG1_02_46_17]
MTQNVPNPVEGKHIFQISNNIRIRYNADGWVEEIGSGGADDPLGTRLQGKPNSKRDDIYARRYYDLYSRCVILDIHPKLTSDMSGTGGIILFKDIEPASPMFARVNLIITIANHHFGMDLKPLAG